MVPQGPRLIGIAAFALVAGCATAFGPAQLPPTAPNSRTEPAVAPPASRAEPAAAPRAAPPVNEAAAALLAESRRAGAAGDDETAAATLERALGIDPNNAALWIELAEVRLRQGDRDQADALARKALTLAGNDRLITSRAERLLERR